MRSREKISTRERLARCGTIAATIVAVSGAMTLAPPSALADVNIGAIGAVNSDCQAGRSWVQLGTNSASPSYTVPAGIDEITQWRTEGDSNGTTSHDVAFQVWRPVPGTSRYALVGQSAAQTVTPGSTAWYTLDPPISYVHQGDVIGLYTVSYFDCYRVTTSTDDRIMSKLGDGTVGTGYDFPTGGTSLLLNIEATGTDNPTVNEPPVAVDDTYRTPAGTQLVVDAPGVLGNDTDPTGDTVAVASGSTGTLSTTAGGTVDLSADGSFSYFPADGFVGSDTFTYQASDGIDPSGTATVTISVPGPVDLDGLGGSSAQLTSLDAGRAAGWAYTTGDVAEHAVVADLNASTPLMLDLGTLGGTDSHAYVVDGGWVVGYSEVAGDTAQHAFAYDLDGRRPAMLDLGTLGGNNSIAYDVDAGRAVGLAYDSNGYQHGFVVDLTARRPVMVDLGAFPGENNSNANAVDGNWVVGSGETGAAWHGAAWNLATTPATMVDLAPLAGDSTSTAFAVSGGWAVGTSGGHAVAWDLTSPSPAPVLLAGSGTPNAAYAVDGTWAAGDTYPSSQTPAVWDLTSGSPSAVTLGTEYGHAWAVGDGWAVGESSSQAFAVDLSDPSHTMVWLGNLGGGSSAYAVGGGWAVGQTQVASGDYHPAAFPLASMSPSSADLAVTVTGASAAHAGKPYTATVAVTNLGPSNATGVTLTIDGTAGTPIALDKGYTRTQAVTVTAGAGGKGATLTITATVSRSSGIPDTSMSNNTATLTVPIRGR